MVERQPKKLAYIVIEADRCKGCRYCLEVCPHQIIGLSKCLNQIGSFPVEVISSKADLCSGCGVCALMCPDTAISVFSSKGEKVLT